jgi:hypothetical protein
MLRDLRFDDGGRTTEDRLKAPACRGRHRRWQISSSVLRRLSSVFGRPGGIGGELVPDPIPNSAVKLPSADGTKPQGLEE